MVFSDEMLCVQAGFYGAPDAENYNPLFMERLWNTSNTLPLAVAMQITRDWVHAGPQADKYERDYADDPLVTHALIDRYYRLKRYDDAERCAQRYVAFRTGVHVVSGAGQCLQSEKRPSSLEGDAGQGDQAAARRARASHGSERDRHRPARAPAMEGSGRLCQRGRGKRFLLVDDDGGPLHEMLGEWEKAEELVKAVSSHYDDHFMNWMCWCHRTGRG